MHYYYHPESESVWQQEETLEVESFDAALVNEISEEEYNKLCGYDKGE
jgi:hypothetical protein